jgi:hypothetical protein
VRRPRRPDALDGVCALEGVDAGAEPHPHAVVVMDVAVDRADLVAEHTLEPLAQRVAVGHAAQVEHAVELAPGDRERARLGAGREQQPVVAQPLAVVEHELALAARRPVRRSMSCSA